MMQMSVITFGIHQGQSHFGENRIHDSFGVDHGPGEEKADGVIDDGLNHEEDIENEKVAHGHGEPKTKYERDYFEPQMNWSAKP